MEATMPVTHVSHKVELFGSHCVVGLGSHGRAGSWRLRCRRVLMLVGSVLFYLAVYGSHPVLLFWMVQPSAPQTLRCFPITQGTCEDAGSDPADLGQG